MKAILVIDDMPTECIECPFHRIYADGFLNETYCSLMAKRNKDGVNTRADWCPLMPMPKRMLGVAKIQNGNIVNVQEISFADGWNACLDAITGEKE